MSEWRHLAHLAVELMVCAMLLTAGLFLTKVGKTSASIQQREADIVATMAEFREFNKYTNTIIWSQDVISTILQYEGRPEIDIVYKSGTKTFYKTDGMHIGTSGAAVLPADVPNSCYTNGYLTPKFGVSAKFKSTIARNPNGEIDKIIMTEQ